ncbi:complement C1q tumor necrosis factor-related protein 3-like [Saccostrea cucullata]|uniref:complement C1q tumor necrosis factor-related protein 3-like n=1 Tax=Saccostrea cuccullata TaxID=36930 RepID=UPI002ED28EEF
MKVLSFAFLLLWMCWVKLEAKENSGVKIDEICSAEIQTLRQEMSALREEVLLQKKEIKQLKNEEPRNPEQKENRQDAQGPLRTFHAASKQKRFQRENTFSSGQFSDQHYKYRGKRWLFGQEQNVSLSTEHQIAFHANSPTHFRNLAVRQTLIFGNVILNVGNYYRNVTGIFTPDVSGVYVFYVQLLMCAGNRFVHTELLVEGVQKSVHYAGTVVRFCANGGGMTIVHVNAGDSVWVRLATTDGVNNFAWESSFSGFLLYED